MKLCIEKAQCFVPAGSLAAVAAQTAPCNELLESGKGAGNDFLGWVHLPSSITDEFLAEVQATADLLRSKAEIIVVAGIGGSYLGPRAVNEALDHTFGLNGNNPRVVYAGNNIGEDYLADLMELLDGKTFAIINISKSGTTTETALAFRLLKTKLEAQVGKEAAKDLIVAVTDKEKGAARKLATKEGYKTFVIPDNVGGRYSVLTPVGLLPIAVAGVNIDELVAGARLMERYCVENQNADNVVAQYAVTRQALYHSGKTTEILVNYEPRLQYFSEWWKQLYGESEGKEGKGIFPASVTFTTDLHSMGQYIQEGVRNLFETVISVENPAREVVVPDDDDNLDQMNYLAGSRLNKINRTAEKATIIAHVDGGVPNIRISVPTISPNVIGQLIYFFEMGCALSGYMLGINPFNQPGVEAYKKNMFALLGKKGYEDLKEQLENRTF